MHTTEPGDSGNPLDNVICPQCSFSMPTYATFCAFCGSPFKQKASEEKEIRSADSDDHTQILEAGETKRVPSLSRIQLKKWQSYQSLNNNGINGPMAQNSLLLQDRGDSTVQDVSGMKSVSDEASTFPQVSRGGTSVTGATSQLWGWLPLLSLTSAIGVLLVALAAEGGRLAAQWADPMFWLGLLVLFLPIAVRMISAKPARRERIALLLMLGGATYFFRFLNYPLYFAYTDEFMHWLGANNIAMSGHLFQINQINPIIPFYPGMEIVTNALSSLTGLSVFGAGSVVLVVGGLVLVLSLYLFFECLSNSAQMAGIATMLYMANPGWFSDTQFAYESLALPLAMFVLFVVAFRSSMPPRRRAAFMLPIWLGLAATVITHHLTSFTLEAFLLLWIAVFFLLWLLPISRQRHIQSGPREAVVVGLVLIVAWMAYTQWRVVPYLFTPLASTVSEFFQFFSGKEAVRQLFKDGSGYVEPLWERAIGLVSTALVTLGLPFGLYQLWRQYRTQALALALALAAIAYPVTQLARLTPAGTVTATRAPVFLFVAVAFVLALGITRFWLSRTPTWRRSAAVIVVIVIVYIGGGVIGTAPLWYRLPGPYLVAADHRSVDPENIDAAEWTLLYLGPGNRIASDRNNYNLLGTFGEQWIVTSQDSKVEVAAVFFSPQFGAGSRGILQYANIQYLLVDYSLSTALPRMGTYFDRSEPDALYHTTPINPAALHKFDGIENVSRIYDSGNIVIYDVEAITNGPENTSGVAPLCKLASPTSVPSSYPKVASVYKGIIYDVATGQSTAMTLTHIQQQQGSFCASFTGLGRTVPVNGSMKSDGQIQFMVTTRTGEAPVTFNGFIEQDGTLDGSYCHAGGKQCIDYGIWSLSAGT